MCDDELTQVNERSSSTREPRTYQSSGERILIGALLVVQRLQLLLGLSREDDLWRYRDDIHSFFGIRMRAEPMDVVLLGECVYLECNNDAAANVSAGG